MALNLLPEPWDLPSLVVGDTFPAIRFQYEGTGTLARVRLKIKAMVRVKTLSFDSDVSGIIIADGTDGAWDFTLSEIPAATTAELPLGSYAYDLETITLSGTVRTLISGTWEIVSQITD